MKQEYIDTVRLLVDIAPDVFTSARFAMKGGTAINLFVQDMPRLSVDIDVVFTDHTLARDDSLQAIQSDLKDAWQVDCSPGSCMHGADYRLALKTPGDLQGVENAVLAPGFVKTEDGSTRLS